MKRLLVIGGSSYLGQHLVPMARSRFDLLYTYFQNDPLGQSAGFRLDIRDRKAVEQLVSTWRPDVIIHTAGSNRSPAMEEVICQGAEHIATSAINHGARLIHLSSDVVFDGLAAPYTESATPTPIHAYGKAKANAEEIVARNDNHVIIRTSLIYGLNIMDHSTSWIKSALSAGQPVTLFTNQIRNPVWVETLSMACLELSQGQFHGIINVAGRQALSRAEFGLKLMDWWGIDERENLKLGPVEGLWPPDCRLDLTKAQALLKTPLPGVDEVLRKHREIRELNQG